MAHDPELDRLKTAQDLAFQRKQRAYGERTQAWERRSHARDELGHAREEQQRAYDYQNAAWQQLQAVRDCNGPRIEWLNSQQENAFQNMKSAFDRASSAHDMRDGASAASYAQEGHRYKAEAQGYVAERRQLVQAIRDLRDRHDATKPAFQRAKERVAAVRATHDKAKAEYERKQAEFEQAKADFDRAREAFKKRLDQVKAEGKRKKDDKRSIAERAGVPYQYLDSVWVSKQPDGSVNIYFGGVGRPDGPGHGHYAMDASGGVTYRRDPFDPHGLDNFTDKSTGWSPRTVGTIEGHTVTFRTGHGRNEGHTLIADGEASGRSFDGRGEHDHYGDKREADGRVEEDGGSRGHYTGPGN